MANKKQRYVRKPFLTSVLALLVPLLFVALNLLARPPQPVQAATSSNLNFQARLLNASGGLVPDGTYNIEFKLYDSLAAGGSAQGVCVGGATDDCVWVETRVGANKVTIKNGYFSVNLASVTAFPALNWDQDMWLTMNIGGTGAPTYDGEMSPRIKLTAVPYALSAGQLAKNNGTNTGQLQFGTIANNPVVTLPDLTGTVALLQNAQTFTGAITFGAAGTGLTVTNNATISGDLAVNGGDITSSGALNLTPGGAMTLGVTTQAATLQGSITTISSTGAGNDIILTTADKITLTGFNCSTGVNGGALSTDASGNLTCTDDDGGLGGSTTLQQAYGADVDGADAIIALTTSDDSIIITNPAAAGTDSGYVLSLDQAAAGAVDGLRVTNAGTGVLASLDSSNATGNGVLIDIQSNSASQYGLQVTTNNAGKAALTVQGDGAVVLGSTTFQASLLLHDGNGQTTTLKAGDSTGNLSFTLPTADGSNTNCLKTNGAGVLSFSNCNNGSGSGGAVTLQDAYDASGTPADILLATGKNLVITSPDVATDPNIVFNLQCATCSAGGGKFTIQDNGTDVFTVNPTGTIDIAGDVTIAAQKTLRLVGGTTAQRPGSPSEGQIYFDTDTKQLLVYGGAAWQNMSRSSTKVVAASNSQTKAGADHIADGEAVAGTGTIDGDQVQIQAAITALPAGGGTVYLMEGTYTVDAAISVPNNVTLAGAGASTLIQLTNTGAGGVNLNAIQNSDRNASAPYDGRITLRDFKLDGSNSTNTNGTQSGVDFARMGEGIGSTATPGAKVTNVWAENFRSYGFALSDSYSNSFIGNTAQGNSAYGFYITSSSQYNTFTGNTARANSHGFYNNSSSYNTFADNSAQGNSFGLLLTSSSHATVTSNIFLSNTTHGIQLNTGSTENVVGNNKIHDSGGSTTNNGIYISDSDSNTVTGNDITDVQCSTNCYAINIFNNTAETNYLADNRFSTLVGTATINDAGTGTVYANQARGANGAQLTTKIASGTDAFQIQNAAGNSLFTVDTTNSEIELGKAGASGIDGKLVIYNAANANTVTLTVGTTSASYNLVLPTSAGAVNECLKNDATTAGVLVFGSCGAGGSTTLQQAYDNDADGSDAIIPLTSADGSLIFRNPASGGTGSSYVMTIDQLSTGATGGLLISSAGTGALLKITDTTATAQDVFNIADGGAITARNQTDSASSFQIQNAAGTAILNVDASNQRVGIGTTTPGEKLEVVGNIISKGTSWTSRTSAANNQWQSVTYGNGLFVAVSDSGSGNRVMTSPDGITWTTRTSAADNSWNEVTYGNGLFVAVASTGSGNRVMTSPDGITWTTRTSAADNLWRSVTYGNGLFVAVSSDGTGNRVMTSPDGITWTSRTSAADNAWISVTYGNGLFVAVAITGGTSRVMTSPDGITWTLRTSANSNSWFSVTYANGLFVAVSSDGTGNRVMTSPDGITWTARTSAADNAWLSVTYANGLFVAVSSDGTGNRVMTSPDGITWTIRTSAADNTWQSVTYANGLFVAVSSDGTGNRVMTSGKQDYIAFSANNTYQGGITVRSGDALFNSGANSTTAFQIQNAAADVLFAADTTNNRLKVGNSTGTGSATTLLVIDSGVSGTPPTGVKGAMYYDTTNDKFQCFKGAGAGAWGDCDTTGAGGGSTRKIYIIPEYAGGILSADGSNNSGTMTSNYDSTNRHHYYEWVNSTGTLNDYDIIVGSQIPSEYVSGFGTFKIWAYGDSNVTTNNDIEVTVRNSSGVACATSVSVLPGTATTWAEATVDVSSGSSGCPNAADFNANDIITITIHVESKSSNKVRIGEISYQYTN